MFDLDTASPSTSDHPDSLVGVFFDPNMAFDKLSVEIGANVKAIGELNINRPIEVAFPMFGKFPT